MKKSKFTIIDALIILIILAVVAVGVLKLAPGIMSGGKKEKVKFRENI